jgi:hypothetical protein
VGIQKRSKGILKLSIARQKESLAMLIKGKGIQKERNVMQE